MSSTKRQSHIGTKEDIIVGSRVLVNNELTGTIKYIGSTSFQTGKWIGVELDEAEGKNSGVVQGKRYFECKTNHGVFTRPSSVKLIQTFEKKSMIPNPRRSITRPIETSPQKSKSIIEPRRKSTVEPPVPSQRRKSIVEPPVPSQRRKSIVEPPVPSQRRKSIVEPPVPSQRRKSIVEPQQRKSTVIASPKPSLSQRPSSTSSRRLTSQKRISSILKPKPPPTAPSTPDHTPEITQDSVTEDFDTLCNTMASPVSIEKEDRREEELTSSEEEDLPESMEESDGDTCPANELQPVYGSLASSKPMSKSDQTVPLKEYEELRFKLKILESKRHEDRERFREHEKIKEEAEQFLTLRNKLQDKISELQKDVREARRELKETSQEKETVETKYVDLLESMEMLTLDKEVAEEKAESLQQETNILKDRMEEISVDLDVLKKEADRMNRPPEERGAHEDERTPLEVIQLERHNERLKDALLRLRDAANDSEAELNLKIKILEQESHELEEIQYQNEKLREQLDSAELLVEDLKVQLDDAVGTEDLVEQLTEKNLNLTERMEELRASVDDLEALKELADELEENHMETEKQLQAEIDHRDMLLREQVERLKANEETMTDYETTIEQFRELVNHLQDDLKELKRKEKADQTEKMSLSSQSQAMMSLNLQLQTTVMKAQAKSIDIELRKLEANQANDRLNMIQPYLPEAFLKTESDSISCLLLFKRLEFKSELVIRHLDQNHPVSEKIMDNVTENLVSMCEIKQRAGWLSSLSTRFQTHIKNCDPEAFAKLGRVYLDLTGVERRMNSIVELFRTDQINAPYCLNELQRIISQVEHLVENVPAQEKNNSDQFFGLTKALDLNADRMIVIFTFCRQMLSNAIRNDELTLLEGVGEMEQDYMEPLGRLITQAKNSKIITKKLIRQLEDKLEEAMTLKGEHMHRFKTLYSISTKLCQFCYEIYRDLVLYVNNKKGSHEPVELCHIKKLLQDKGDDIFELTESSMWESSMRALRSLTNELETTTLQIEGDDKLDKIMVKVAPWIQRASDIKAEVVVNRELEYKLQQYNEEIVRLVKDGKLKEQTLQESEVKINLLEKRMVVARKEIEHVKALEEDLEKSLNQERLLENAMETLENENDALENEISQLKKEASKKEEKRQSLIRKATFDLAEQEDTSTMQEMAGNYYAMSNQMETLRTSVRYLRAENAHLKSLDFARSLDLALDPISAVENVPDDRSKSLARETRVLIKDLRVAGASPRIIPLSTPQPHSMQPSVLYTLQQRSTLLRNQISALHHVQNKESSRTLQTLALVKIPNLIQNAASKHAIHLKSVTEFKQLHSLFMPA